MLSEILAKAPLTSAFPDLIVGTESCDDAAVYRLNDTQALVATTDFFMPIVDDPYDFGRIAATNAISDVYAMGGKPMMALALLGMPVGKVSVETIQRIVAGGQAVCQAAGIPIAGGHSIDSTEPIYGLVALGLVHPDRIKRNDRARPGDVLILGKPLGVGIMSAALKKGELSAEAYRQLIDSTTKLNTPGMRARRTGRRPCRDRRDRLRSDRTSDGGVSRLGAARPCALCRRAVARGRRGTRRAGLCDRRIRSQLGELRGVRGAPRQRAALAPQAAHGPADERRTARCVLARGCVLACSTFSAKKGSSARR